MIIDKSYQYFIGYISVSIALISWSVYSSLEISPNVFTFLIEFTDGYKLGILLNFLFLSFVLSGKFIQVLLFGHLRIIEVEHLVEKLPIYFINLLFNLTTNDNNLILNCLLLGIAVSFKIFHVILIDRLDYIHMKIFNNSSNERYTTYNILQKYLTSLYFWLILLFIISDFAIAKFLVYDVFQGINSVTCLLFGFQFAVQGVEALTYYSKLVLNIYELAFYRHQQDDFDIDEEDEEEEEDNERVWDNKAFFSKSIDICSASLKAISYLGFIYLLTIHSGLSLPISMLQGTYLSLKQTYKEISQLFAFIESSKKLDSQLPNATKEELESSDNLCIICREDMYALDEYERTHHKSLPARRYPKKLNCGHILHMGCLKDWLERSEICPLCRRKVFQAEENDLQQQTQGEAQPAAQPAAQPVAQPAAQPAAQPEVALQTQQAQPTGTNEESRIRNADDEIQRNQNILNELNIPAEYPEPTITPPPTRTTEPSEVYQTIRLPTTAIIPQDWTILPLHRSTNEQYKVDFSTFNQGTLTIKRKPPGNELSVIEPNLSSYNGHEIRINDPRNAHPTNESN
mmetsp:Transcript_5686/g.6784  ORF Transcript_5686/g.6784 Transcript_5686/m.6784 type:complete len:572 (+) Transcript_5686:1507-3222(+)